VIRYVHHQLVVITTAVCACAVSAPVSFGVHGELPVVDDTVWTFVLILLGCHVFYGLLQASRLKWFSEVRDFETAVLLEDPEAVLPADYSVRRLLVHWGFFGVDLVPWLAMGLAVNPWLSLIPLAMVPDRLIQAAIAVRWERKHGVLLWRGHVPSRPWELSYSRVRPTRPTAR
jgi:hypothetical protein